MKTIAIALTLALTTLITSAPTARASTESIAQNALYIGPSLAFNAPATDLNSLGGTIALLIRLPGSRFSLGFESGYLVFNETSTQMAESGGTTTVLSQTEITAKTIPLLVACQYELSEGTFVPYIGLAAGLGVISATDGTDSASETRLMAILKPGVRISSFFIEPKVGVIGESLAFLPTLGLALQF